MTTVLIVDDDAPFRRVARLLTSTDATARSAAALEASGAVGFVPKLDLVATDLRHLLGSAP